MQPLNKTKIFFLIFIAVAIGAIYFLPNILVPYFQNQAKGGGYSWRDMAFYNPEEMFSYGVNIRDIFDGHIKGGDPYLWEYKDMPTTWDYYPLSFVTGLFFKLFHFNSITMFFVLGDFIFPPISFLIIFFLFLKITARFLFSVASSLIFLFFPNLFVLRKIFTVDFYNHFSLLNFSELFSGAFNSGFSRLFVSSLTMIFLSAFLFFLYYSISEDKTKKLWLVVCGIAYGLLFYVYFYYWVFATISLGILATLFLFHKKELFWRVIRILIYGIVVSIPYWIRFFILSGNPIYGEITQRIGLLKGMVFVSPAGGYWVILLVFIFFGIIFWKKIKQKELFFYALSLLSAVLVARNLQIIFGFNPQPDHWGSRVGVYMIVFSFLILLYYFLDIFFDKYQRALQVVLFTIILFLITIALSCQIVESQNSIYIEDVLPLQSEIMDSFEWINENTGKDSVFITDAKMTQIALPFYTHANTYLPHACLTLASNAEILDRYQEIYALYGVPVKMLEDFFMQKNGSYNSSQRRNLDTDFSMFCVMYRTFLENSVIKLGTPKEVVSEFLEKYKKIKPNLDNLRYRADYLFYGPYERSIGDFDADRYSELVLVYSNNSVKIYKILK